MNLHEHRTQVGCDPDTLFELLNDVDYLSEHMPHSDQASDGQPWVRVDEDGCTLSWGSGRLRPGTLDVMPTDAGSELVLRVTADADVADELAAATDDVLRRAETRLRLAA